MKIIFGLSYLLMNLLWVKNLNWIHKTEKKNHTKWSIFVLEIIKSYYTYNINNLETSIAFFANLVALIMLYKNWITLL
jgi:hypothetical protein